MDSPLDPCGRSNANFDCGSNRASNRLGRSDWGSLGWLNSEKLVDYRSLTASCVLGQFVSLYGQMSVLAKRF